MKKNLIISSFLLSMFFLPFLICGCNQAYANLDKSSLSLVEPETQQKYLDDIPVARYKVKTRNEEGKEGELEFSYPWYAAIGGKISNETGSYEQSPPGQVNYSTVLGLATRKYFLWTAERTDAIVALQRDPYDWNEIKKMVEEIGGRANVDKNGKIRHLPSLQSSLTEENIKNHVWGKNVAPELFVTGALTEVTVGEESFAAGVILAGVGPSSKVVQTSVSGSVEMTNPYTGELLVSVMGQNRVSAYQVGIGVFRIVSAFGVDDEFLNTEFTIAREMIKQQVQVELIDFLFYAAFKKLYETHPEYLTERLHFKLGEIKKYAEKLAKKKGLTIIGEPVAVSESLS